MTNEKDLCGTSLTAGEGVSVSASESAIARHTPTPWHVGPYYKFDIESRVGRVAECRQFTPQGITDAEFIVRACNSHEELLDALKRLANEMSGAIHLGADAFIEVLGVTNLRCIARAVDNAQAAIAKAEGRQRHDATPENSAPTRRSEAP